MPRPDRHPAGRPIARPDEKKPLGRAHLGFALLVVSMPALLSAFLYKPEEMAWVRYLFRDSHGPFRVSLGLVLLALGVALAWPVRKAKQLYLLDPMAVFLAVTAAGYFRSSPGRAVVLGLFTFAYAFARVQALEASERGGRQGRR